jgi:hypothetical protein
VGGNRTVVHGCVGSPFLTFKQDTTMTPQALAATSRQALLQQLKLHVTATTHQYSVLLPTNINPQPILYFGDPWTAEFATIGLNPAAAELTWQRWPHASMTDQELDARCVDYFRKPTVPPNDWFDGYELPANTKGPAKALNLLGRSYLNDAVHLDLSPRATVPRSTMAGQLRTGKITKATFNNFVQSFRAMVAADLTWFFSALALCPTLKAAIMAGTVANDARRDYLYQVLQANLPSGYSLTARRELPPKSCGDTALYDLVGTQLNLPILFVSESPSAGRGSTSGMKIANAVQQHLSLLKKLGF